MGELGWIEREFTGFACAGQEEGLCSINSSVIFDVISQQSMKHRTDNQNHCHTSSEN